MQMRRRFLQSQSLLLGQQIHLGDPQWGLNPEGQGGWKERTGYRPAWGLGTLPQAPLFELICTDKVLAPKSGQENSNSKL